MTSQTVDFKVRADTKQAQAEVDNLNNKFKAGATAADMLDRRIESLTKDLDDLSNAVVSGKGNTEAYRVEMQRLERQLDAIHGTLPKVGGAVQEVAKTKRNLGQATLEASRAFEDLQYGIGGVINNIPSLLQSLGAGAGLTGVLAAGTVVIYKGGEAIYNLYKEMEEANKINDEWDKGLEKVTGRLRDRFTVAVNDAQTAVREASKELRQFGMDANETRADDIRANIDFQKGRLANIDTDAPARQKRIDEAQALLDAEQNRQLKLTAERRAQLKEQIAVENVILQESKKNRDAATKAIVDEEKALKSLEDIKKQIDQKEKERDAAKEAERLAAKGAKASTRAAKREDDEWQRDQDREQAARDRAMLSANTEQLVRSGGRALGIEEEYNAKLAMLEAFEEFDKKAKKDREDAEKLHQRRLDSLMSGSWADRLAFSAAFADEELTNLDRLSREEWRILQERQDGWASFYEGVQQHAVGAIGVVTSAGSAMLDDIITGQELAFETFATSIMKSAGQSLIGSGTKLAGEATVSLLTPGLQPLAAAQFAGAAGLIGSGVALGGVATGIMHTAQGGTIGKALPDKDSRKDRGASPSGSSSGSGGPLIVNISYGVGGPLPEDTAREVRKVLEVDSRR